MVVAFVDGSAHKKRQMALYAWAGSFFAALLFFIFLMCVFLLRLSVVK